MVSRIITFENLPLFVAFIFLLFSSGGAGNNTAVKLFRCKDNERQALLDFKKEIVEDSGLLSSWGSQEEDCCKWRGIQCSNNTGHVILLDLHGWFDYAAQKWVGLIGKVSPSLLELNQLKYLDLSSNSFYSSPIPEFIGSLSKLQHLNLSHANFVGRVPHQLGNLTNLKYLDLSDNPFLDSSPIPEFIGSLSKLQHLDLSDSDFVGRVPHQLGNLTNLRSLDLRYNSDLNVENLEWLSDLRLLQHLDLSRIDLQKVDLLQSIDRLSFLSSLHLAQCNLPGIISPSLHLTNFSSIPLSVIDLSFNSFSNSSIYNWLFNFSSSLVDVDMSYNPLVGSIPDAFGNMMSLESLSLSFCSLEGEIPKSFKTLSRLLSLDLSSNNLTGQLPELFETLFASKNSLELLKLSGNRVGGSLPDFTSFSSLRRLSVGLNELNGSFPKRFAQSSPLEYLGLSDNELNGSLPDLTSFPMLRYLSLTNNKLEGRIPDSIGELSNLKELYLSFNLLTLEFSSDWTPRFQLDAIGLANCKLGPHFPEWLLSQSNFSVLHMSSAGILDTVPHWFWDLSPTLKYLNISNNHIHGVLPDLSLKFVELDQIDLSSNRFEGPIPLFPRNLSSLNLSKNMFSGSIISLCTIVTEFLSFLDLADNLLSWSGFVGRVPHQLGNLTNLKYLDLSHNDLVGRVPHQLGNLTNLKYLDLSQNNLVGRVPHQLGNLTNLRSLDLGYNPDLTVENLEWLSDLRLLQHLDLSSIDLQKVDLLQSINRLSFLSSLHLAQCNLPGIISPSLHLTNFSSIPLSVIDLSDNSFTNSSSYSWLFNFSSSLVDVDMSYSPFESSIPDAFGNMMSLETLRLFYCSLEGEIPKSFKNLTRIRSLDLSWNNLTGQLPELFQRLFASKNSLELLELRQNKVSGSLPDFTSFSSLRQLHLGSNKLNGSFPKRFGRSSPLEYLDLSDNELNGSLPDLTSFPLLRYLSLTNNKIQGRLPESIGELSKLKELDLSFNLLTLEFSSDWTPRVQLDFIALSNCTLGPHFPEWLRSQSNLSVLHMFRVGIFDIVPHWFWDLSPRLQYLNISDNHIHDVLPDLSLKFVELVQVDLSSNRFEGPVPLFPRNLSSLDLSKNMFSGSITSLCTIVTEFLSFLDLSDNLLSGEVPDCWIDANNLEILDLANNNFSWKIPPSFGFLHRLKLLNLRNNSLIGELPSSLKNCSSLGVFDTSENKLSGQLPAWIGTNLTLLVVLSFRSNEFHGSIPLSMCLLNHTQVLDLSQNKISGNIPQCFNKFYSLIQIESSSTTMSIELSDGLRIIYLDDSHLYDFFGDYVPSALVQWKGKDLEYKSTLGLLKCIDLSSNKLVGQIPQELASLVGLRSLNLSRNNLTGHVIQNISQMKELEILDLSRNHLFGAIPIGLGSLHFLNVLDLSSNNFLGKIPRSTQLNTFNASVYAGNDKLCGYPLQNECPEDESTSVPPSTDHGKVEDTFVTTGFYVSVVLGFAIGFWGFIGPLMLRSSWRCAYFKLLDKIQDRIYVTIAVKMARVQRKFKG